MEWFIWTIARTFRCVHGEPDFDRTRLARGLPCAHAGRALRWQFDGEVRLKRYSTAGCIADANLRTRWQSEARRRLCDRRAGVGGRSCGEQFHAGCKAKTQSVPTGGRVGVWCWILTEKRMKCAGWRWKGNEYRPLPQDKHGVVRSRVFPGLWLDTKALLAGNAAGVLATLQRGLKSAEHGVFVKRK